MSGSRAASRYAKAILDLALSKGVAQEVYNDMTLVAQTVSENQELSNFIQSPSIAGNVKESALLEIFAGTDTVTKGLFHLLKENKRFEILGFIASNFTTLFDEMNGFEIAKVTTAIPMDADLEAKVATKIREFSNKKITIQNIVDPSIIGGFILRIGDKQYNASIANRLQVLKREFSNN